MKVAILLLANCLAAQEAARVALNPPRRILKEGESITLVENPQPQTRKPGFWRFGSFDRGAPLRTNREVFHDRLWLGTQSVWLGSIIFDSEITHEGLAHARGCTESNTDLPSHPSRAQIYRSDLPEYAVGSAFNWLMMKYVSKSIILEFPSYSTVKHLQGGTTWLKNCW